MKKKNELKLVLFLLFLLVGWKCSENILKYPKQTDWVTKGMEQIYAKPNYYDVIWAGTSMAVTNVSAEELYLNYGIASRSIGEPEQMFFLSYYALKEALIYQKPKVVFLDVQAIFYSEEREKSLFDANEQQAGHFTLDSMRNGKNKYDAVTEIKKIHASSTYEEYFSKMYYNHSNWEEISEDNFKFTQGQNMILGNRSLTDILENVSSDNYVSWNDNTMDEAYILEKNIVYLEKIINLCRKNKVELVLIRGCGSKIWSWQQYNAIINLANRYKVDYLDLSIVEKQIGFDWSVDSEDDVHHNIVGTKKWTDFLGEYLVKKYNFIDRRKDNKYFEYEENQDRYESILNLVEQKISLLKSNHFKQFLETISNMEKENVAILLSINGEINLTTTGRSLLEEIGFHMQVNSEKIVGYCAVLDDGKILIEHKDTDEEISNCLSDGTIFEISSKIENSSIKINNQELIQGGKGINVVVYNKKCKELVSSVFFNTTSNNAKVSRINSAGEVESEIEINCWK